MIVKNIQLYIFFFLLLYQIVYCNNNNNNILQDKNIISFKNNLVCLTKLPGCNIAQKNNWNGNQIPGPNDTAVIEFQNNSPFERFNLFLRNSTWQIGSLTIGSQIEFNITYSYIHITDKLLLNHTIVKLNESQLTVDTMDVGYSDFKSYKSIMLVSSFLQVVESEFLVVRGQAFFRVAINFRDSRPKFYQGSYTFDSQNLVQCNFFIGLESWNSSTVYINNCQIWEDSTFENLVIRGDLMINGANLDITHSLSVDPGLTDVSLQLKASHLEYTAKQNLTMTNISMSFSTANIACHSVNITNLISTDSSTLNISNAYSISLQNLEIDKLLILNYNSQSQINLTSININRIQFNSNNYNRSIIKEKKFIDIDNYHFYKFSGQQQVKYNNNSYPKFSFFGNSQINSSFTLENVALEVAENSSLELGGSMVSLNQYGSVYLYGQISFNGTFSVGSQGLLMLGDTSLLKAQTNSCHIIGSTNIQNHGQLQVYGNLQVDGDILVDYGAIHFMTSQPTLQLNGDLVMGEQGMLSFEALKPNTNPPIAVNGSVYLSGTLHALLVNATQMDFIYNTIHVIYPNHSIYNEFKSPYIDCLDDCTLKAKVQVNSTWVILNLYDGYVHSSLATWKILLIVGSSLIILLIPIGYFYHRFKLNRLKINNNNNNNSNNNNSISIDDSISLKSSASISQKDIDPSIIDKSNSTLIDNSLDIFDDSSILSSSNNSSISNNNNNNNNDNDCDSDSKLMKTINRKGFLGLVRKFIHQGSSSSSLEMAPLTKSLIKDET
ncbi:RhoGEF domain-containing protein [Tieghemostelium lacteum]|uniref:RhoGEF domain-containing protein n=1 Tax=Tieghemostelium lacteum TaxID=361077 RepID=A0A152A4M3_TIELA|nr:RhoGEF domain-containing protein [Tieghemostelium lacteum]|eukprot:KYR01192.1 RhoGEF domain-containing protein [Tieghemostelium lacteum]